MTTQTDFPTRNRDQQDGTELHVWRQLEYVKDAGAILSVNGTGTQDDEVPVINGGYSFNLPNDYNTEVILFSLGSDTNKKFALPTLPRDKQRQWKVGTGGVQNPTNGDKALEFNDKRAHMIESNVALGKGGLFEVDEKNGVVYIRGDLVIKGDLKVGGSLQVKGSIDADGHGKYGGSLNAPAVNSPGGSSNNQAPSVNVNVPGFEA